MIPTMPMMQESEQIRYIHFPNLICASANSSRPRRKLISLNGSGLGEGAPTQGQERGEYSLQSLHQVA